MIPYLSSCKSPQSDDGFGGQKPFCTDRRDSREDLYVVSVVPCLAKKSEAARPEFAPDGIRDVDAVLTSAKCSRWSGLP
jgi:formate dehydrogenase major subunit